MNKFVPTSYYKSVFAINYNKLKARGVKCLLFDLDNTLGLIDEQMAHQRAIDLVKKLKKDFIVVIISNNNKKRIAKYVEAFEVEYISFSMKPFSFGLIKVRKKYNLTKQQMVIIGDQLMTDILAGNFYKINGILVDPLGKKDLKITTINRFFERLVLKRLKSKGILERGIYYE